MGSERTFTLDEPDGFDRFMEAVEGQEEFARYLRFRRGTMAKSDGPTFRLVTSDPAVTHLYVPPPGALTDAVVIRWGEDIRLFYEDGLPKRYDRQPQLEEALFEIGERLVGDAGTREILEHYGEGEEKPVRHVRFQERRKEPSPTLDDLFGDGEDLHPAEREAMDEMGAGALREAVDDVDLEGPGRFERYCQVTGAPIFSCGKEDCDGQITATNIRKDSRPGRSLNEIRTGHIHACDDCGALYELVKTPGVGGAERMVRRTDLEGHDG